MSEAPQDDGSTLPEPSYAQILEDAERVQTIRDAELPVTRARAASWARGVGALIAVGLAFTLVKGRSDLGELPPGFAVAVGVVLVVAIGCAVVSALSLFNAAYGRLSATPVDIPDHDLAAQTMADLRRGLGWALAGLVFLLAAVGLTWYGPPAAGPYVRVTDVSGATWCGSPVLTHTGEMTLAVEEQQVRVDLSSAARIEAVSRCS